MNDYYMKSKLLEELLNQSQNANLPGLSEYKPKIEAPYMDANPEFKMPEDEGQGTWGTAAQVVGRAMLAMMANTTSQPLLGAASVGLKGSAFKAPKGYYPTGKYRSLLATYLR